jgi:putative ABC transport system permease protein
VIGAFWHGVAQDARHLVRSLRRSPGFAIIAILTLGLGIGVTTAVVSVVDHVLLRSLPFRDAGQLAFVLERGERGGFRPASAPTAADWRRDPAARQAFEDITFVRGDGALIAAGDNAERVSVAYVEPQFFHLMGPRLTLGRALIEDDHRADAPNAAVVSNDLWQRLFGGDPGILGRRVLIDSVPTTVVGVMAPGARYPGFAAAWMPLSHYSHKEVLTRRGLHADSRTVARLRPGVDSARAMALMRTVSGQLASQYPAEQAHWSAAMLPLRDEVLGNVQPMLLTLGGAAAAVLLLACVNVANLLLARLAGRSRELAVRGALGASSWRIARQLLTESALLAAAGAIVGTLLASFAIDIARKLPSNLLPRAEELGMDGRVLAVALGASVLTLLLCGAWPALRASRGTAGDTLRAGSRGSIGARNDARGRRTMVALQFALALVLLVGAGLLMQSFRRAAAVDVGFEPRNLVAVRFTAPKSYAAASDAATLYARLIAAVRAVPGVTDAAFINHAPFHSAAITTPVEIEGHSASDTASRQVFYRTVSDSYLHTMGMTLASGRWFDANDVRSPGGAFVINETMARTYWPGQTAVGQRLTVRRSSQARPDFGQPLAGSVIGVIHDVHQASQDAVPVPEVYVPYTLETWPWGSLIVRTRDGARAIPALRTAIASVDPRLIERGAAGDQAFDTFESAIASQLDSRKLPMRLIGAFALTALILAAIGMYGVVSYGIAQRTRELGVRKALGATDGMIASLVLRESFVVAGIGIVAGCAAGIGAARLIRGLLFNTGTVDPLAYAATIALLLLVTLIATFVPMRRATRLDAAVALRGD